MENEPNLDVSVIILCYRSKQHLAMLLPSLLESRMSYSGEIIIVDNGSADGTAEFAEKFAAGLPQTSWKFKVIRNHNSGFAAGNNLGMLRASGRFLLLLNPDTKVSPDTIQTMLDFMVSRSQVGISGCKLVMADGKLDLACRRRFPDPKIAFFRLFFGRRESYNYSDRDQDLPMEVDSVVGAFLLISRQAFNRIGPLDEDFFMYGEDLDWCWRCKQAGYQVWYYPKTTVIHYKGQSSRQIPFRSLKWFHDAMWIFYRKHYSPLYPAVFGWAVFLAIYGRLAALVALNFLPGRKGRAP